MKKIAIILLGAVLISCSKEGTINNNTTGNQSASAAKPASIIVSASELVGNWVPLNGGEAITISQNQSSGADKFLLHDGNTNLLTTQKADGGLYVFDDKLIGYDESQHQILYKLNRYKRQ